MKLSSISPSEMAMDSFTRIIGHHHFAQADDPLNVNAGFRSAWMLAFPDNNKGAGAYAMA
jgi:hypothetical protein